MDEHLDELLEGLPTPLYQLIRAYQDEAQPFRRVHRLIDAFEWALKWHTTLALSDLLHRQTDRSDKIKALLSTSLYRPSLGIWVHCFKEIIKDENLPSPLYPWHQWERITEIEKDGRNIVNFRNIYAHGATPSDEQCASDCEEWFPTLERLIDSPYFRELQLLMAGDSGVSRWVGGEVLKSHAELDLHHVGLVHRDDPDALLFKLWPLGISGSGGADAPSQRFFYFNALRNKTLERLNYEVPLTVREKSEWLAFMERLPLDEWKKIQNPNLDLFRERIELLTSNFKGRFEERARLREFCDHKSGALMIWGSPGIGKSALIAQTFKELKTGTLLEGEHLERERPHIIPYLIRRGEASASPDRFLRYLCFELDQCYQLEGCTLGSTTLELHEALMVRLQRISHNKSASRATLFIDGLDEALSYQTTILQYIPKPRFWLSIICASRLTPPVNDWYKRWRDYGTEELHIGPISPKDIRAMLYEVVNKYSDQLTESYINAIMERSAGNPLYIKLLCEELFQGEHRLGDVERLPKDLQEIYHEALHRITARGDRGDLVELLSLFAESKDALSIEIVSDFFKINRIQAQSRVDDLLELLLKRERAGERHDQVSYVLFHESLREYLRATELQATNKARCSIADYTFAWRKRRNSGLSHALSYALSYASHHLSDLSDGERLWELMSDDEYIRQQIDSSRQYADTFELCERALAWYVDQQGSTPELDAHLAQLVLKSGELAWSAKRGAHEAIRWFEEDSGALEESLDRLGVLDEPQLFSACVLLMWIEAARQRSWPEHDRDSQVPKRILSVVDERIPEGTGTIDWSKVLHERFMAFWVQEISSVWTDVDVSKMLKRGSLSSIQYIIKQCITKEVDEEIIRRILGNPQEPVSYPKLLSEAAKELVLIGQSDRGISLIDKALISSQGFTSKNSFNSLESILSNAMSTGHSERFISWSECALDIVRGVEEAYIVPTLLKVAEMLSIGGDYEGNMSVMSRALEITRRVDHQESRSRGLHNIASTYARIGMLSNQDELYNLALGVIREMVDDISRLFTFQGVASSYLTKHYSSGGCLLGKFVKTSLNIKNDLNRFSTLSYLAEDMAYHGDLDYALTLIESINDAEYRPNFLRRVAISTSKRGEFDRALQLIADIKLNNVRDDALRNIAKDISERGDQERAKLIIKDIEDPSIQSQALICVAENLLEIGDVASATDIIDDIKDDQLRLESLCKMMSKRCDNIELFMKTLSQVKSEQTKDQLFNSLLNHLIESGLTDDELSCITKFGDESQISRAVSVSSLRLINEGQLEQARSQFIKCLSTRDQTKRVEIRDGTLRRAAQTIAHTRGIDHSLAIIAQIQDPQIRSRSLSDLAIRNMNAGDLDRSLAIISKMNDSMVKYHAFSELLSQLDRCDHVDLRDQNVVDHVLSAVRSVQDINAESSLLKSLSTHLAKLGDQSHALRIIDHIQVKREQLEALNDTAEIATSSGDLERAQAILNRSLTLIEELHSDDTRSEALSSLAVNLAKCGDVEYALGLTDQIKIGRIKYGALEGIAQAVAERSKVDEALEIASRIQDVWYRHSALSSISEVAARSGEAERALDIISELEGHQRSTALDAIAHELTLLGKYDQALEVIAELEDKTYLYKTLIGIIKSSQKHESVDEMMNMISRYIDTAEESLEGQEHYTLFLICVAEAEINLGELESARSRLEHALKTSRQIKKRRHSSGIINNLAIMFWKSGDLSKALNTISEIPDMHARASGLNRLISELMTSRDSHPSSSWQQLHNYLLTSVQPRVFYQEFLPKYQSNLTDLSQLRSSLLYCPFDLEITYKSISNLIVKLYTLGHVEHAHRIIEMIPELELDCLLLGEESLRYDNLDAWGLRITDKYDYKQVELWASRVAGGGADETWFNRQVAELNPELIAKYTYANRNVWIARVADEDDREQLELWARRVASGQMDDTCFELKVRELLHLDAE